MHNKKILNRSLSVIVSLAVLSMTACSEAPKVTSDSETGFAESKDSGEVSETIEQKEAKEVQTDADGVLTCEIGSGENKLFIHADVSECKDKTTVAEVTVAAIDEPLDQEKIKQQFFDKEAGELADTTGQQEDTVSDGMGEEQSEEYEPAETVEQPDALSAGRSAVYLESEDGEESLECQSDGFAYTNRERQIKFQEIHNNGSLQNVEMNSFAAEKDKLNQALRTMGLEDAHIRGVKQYADGAGASYYEVDFQPELAGIPIVSGYEITDEKYLPVVGTASWSEEGFAEVRLENGMFQVESQEEKECLTLGQALSVLEKYVDSTAIYTTDGWNYTSVELAYLPELVSGEINMIPVWQFCVPLQTFDELGDDLVGQASANGTPMNICINAWTGDLEYVY